MTRWIHESGHVTFPRTFYNVCNILIEMSTFKQALELTFRRNKFGRTTVHQVLSVKLSGTGLPDFRKLILTVLRVFNAKHEPKIIQNRDFIHFDNASFRVDLLQKCSSKCSA